MSIQNIRRPLVRYIARAGIGSALGSLVLVIQAGIEDRGRIVTALIGVPATSDIKVDGGLTLVELRGTAAVMPCSCAGLF